MARFTIENGNIVETPTESEPKKKRKKSGTGISDPETREICFTYFIPEFVKVFDYAYPGDRYKDCSSIYAFLHNTQYNVEFLKEMMDFVLNDKNGYWQGKPVSINLLCYGRTHYDIIDAVQKKKKAITAPDLGNFLEDLI